MQHSFQDLERLMADRTCKIENLVIPTVTNITGMYASPGSGWRFKYTITSK